MGFVTGAETVVGVVYLGIVLGLLLYLKIMESEREK